MAHDTQPAPSALLSGDRPARQPERRGACHAHVATRRDPGGREARNPFRNCLAGTTSQWRRRDARRRSIPGAHRSGIGPAARCVGRYTFAARRTRRLHPPRALAPARCAERGGRIRQLQRGGAGQHTSQSSVHGSARELERTLRVTAIRENQLRLTPTREAERLPGCASGSPSASSRRHTPKSARWPATNPAAP